VNKNRISELIKVTRAHEEQIRRDGYRANETSDALRAQYDKLRSESTPEEIELFERIEF
jgi:hypothetical protein